MSCVFPACGPERNFARQQQINMETPDPYAWFCQHSLLRWSRLILSSHRQLATFFPTLSDELPPLLFCWCVEPFQIEEQSTPKQILPVAPRTRSEPTAQDSMLWLLSEPQPHFHVTDCSVERKPCLVSPLSLSWQYTHTELKQGKGVSLLRGQKVPTAITLPISYRLDPHLYKRHFFF